jgi:hypothetical protein
MTLGMTVVERVKDRRIPLATAWICCWIIWMAALTWLAFDGIILMVVQAALASWISTIATTMSYWLSERARSIIVSRGIWVAMNAALFVGGATTLALGMNFGFTYNYIDPDSKIPFVGLSRTAFLASSFAINFSLANFRLDRTPTR